MASKRKRRSQRPAEATPSSDHGRPALEVPAAPPPPQRSSAGGRRWRDHLIVLLFLSLQLGVPISYYLGDDVYDERFAWRMFSPIRMVKCDVRFSETPDITQAIRLDREIGETWINWMRRGHHRVIDGYARFHCQQASAKGEEASLHAQVACHLPDGAMDRLYSPQEDLCAAR